MKKLSRDEMKKVMGGSYPPICAFVCCQWPEGQGCRTGWEAVISTTTCDIAVTQAQCFNGRVTSCGCGVGPGNA